MLKYLLWAILFYFLIRFIFNFLIPVIRTGRHMRAQMKEFQNNMNQQNQFDNSKNEYNAAPQQQKNHKEKTGDYIDFEEVKK